MSMNTNGSLLDVIFKHVELLEKMCDEAPDFHECPLTGCVICEYRMALHQLWSLCSEIVDPHKCSSPRAADILLQTGRAEKQPEVVDDNASCDGCGVEVGPANLTPLPDADSEPPVDRLLCRNCHEQYSSFMPLPLLAREAS